MQTINFWNKLNLQGKQIILILVVSLLALKSTQAQIRPGVNSPNYDERPIHYGFLISGHVSSYKIKYSSRFTNTMDSLRSINSKNSPGFSLGLIINYRLGEYFDTRLLPAITFYNYTVEYNIDGVTRTKTNSPVMAEFSFLVKYKSQRKKNTRVYVLGGFKPSIEVTPKTTDNPDDQLILQNSNVSLEYGIGMDVYFPMFKFSPEVRFSHGLMNLLDVNNDWSRGMEKLTSHSVTFLILFE